MLDSGKLQPFPEVGGQWACPIPLLIEAQSRSMQRVPIEQQLAREFWRPARRNKL